MTPDIAERMARALINRNQGEYEELLNQVTEVALQGINTQPILHEAALLVEQYKKSDIMNPETVKIYVNFLGSKSTAKSAIQHPFISCHAVMLQHSALRAMYSNPALIPQFIGDAMAQHKATDAELCIPRRVLGLGEDGTIFLKTWEETRGRKPKQ